VCSNWNFFVFPGRHFEKQRVNGKEFKEKKRIIAINRRK
jgi:hypothetical protein